MDLFDAIANRRSIRRFKPGPLADETVARLLDAARLAPSGTNAQPWKLLVVRNPETRMRIKDAAYGQVMFEQAPVTIVLLGDRKINKKRLRRGKELVEIGAVDPEVMETVGAVYKSRGRESAGSEDGAILANCMLAGQNLILAATALGLGTCWVMLMDKAKLAEALALPDHLFPVALIPVGVPDQDPAPRPRYALGDVACNESIDRPWE